LGLILVLEPTGTSFGCFVYTVPAIRPLQCSDFCAKHLPTKRLAHYENGKTVKALERAIRIRVEHRQAYSHTVRAISAKPRYGKDPVRAAREREICRARRLYRLVRARAKGTGREDWELHGKEALAIYRTKFPDRYVENYAMLARVIRLEADVKHTVSKPKTIAEALDELEGKVGKDGRRKFEKFLRSMGEELDDEDDVIDVEAK
jgi:hypothetical protein